MQFILHCVAWAGVTSLGTALLFALTYLLVKFLEIALSEFGSMLVITHADRRAEHSQLHGSDLETAEYPDVVDP